MKAAEKAPVFAARYISPIGGVTMTSDGENLTGLFFDGQRRFAAKGAAAQEARESLQIFSAAREWLDIYFSGEEPPFTPPLSLGAPSFSRAVWMALMEIPWGATASYGELSLKAAERFGGSRPCARAAGAACARNPIALIVPCHRAVGADGSLTGYAGGLERKAWLLNMEKNAGRQV